MLLELASVIVGIATASAVVVAAYVSGRHGRRNDVMKLAVSAGEEAFRRDRLDKVHKEPLPLSFYIYFHYRFLHLVERGQATPDRVRDLNHVQKTLLDAVRAGPWAQSAPSDATNFITSSPTSVSPGASRMDDREVAMKFYEAGMTEFLARIKLRDTTLLFFLGAAGAVGAFSMQNVGERAGFLLFIPYLAGACGAMMSYQSIFVDSLLEYYHLHLRDRFGATLPFELAPSFAKRGMLAVKFRTIGNGLTLTTPGIIALVLTWDWVQPSVSTKILWGLGIIFGIVGPALFVTSDLFHVRDVRKRASEATSLSPPSDNTEQQASALASRG